jgi:glycine cleavage system regulatory protein
VATLVLTVIGDDRAGLVDALAGVITQRGGNWERSQLAELAGKFAGIVVVDVADGAVDALTADLAQLAGLLHVAAERADGTSTLVPQRSIRFTLDLLGADRPGIVKEVSAILAAHQVNIDDLRTDTRDAPMAGGTLFEATIAASAAASLDRAALQASLEAIASELMVELAVTDQAN